MAFGPPYAYTFVRLAYGPAWSTTAAPQALAWYCLYILALGLNGILEAFQHAVASPAELARANAWLIAFAGAHLAAAVSLVSGYGAVGLIVADGISMAARIAYSLAFIRARLAGSGSAGRPAGALQGLLLTKQTLAVFAAAGLLATASNVVLLGGPAQLGGACQVWQGRPFVQAAAVHVAVGAALLGCCVLGLLRTERGLVRALRAAQKGHAD